jgi:hypothetical protein
LQETCRGRGEPRPPLHPPAVPLRNHKDRSPGPRSYRCARPASGRSRATSCMASTAVPTATTAAPCSVSPRTRAGRMWGRPRRGGSAASGSALRRQTQAPSSVGRTLGAPLAPVTGRSSAARDGGTGTPPPQEQPAPCQVNRATWHHQVHLKGLRGVSSSGSSMSRPRQDLRSLATVSGHAGRAGPPCRAR